MPQTVPQGEESGAGGTCLARGLTPVHAAPVNPATHQLPPPSRAEHRTPYLTPFSPQPSLDRADCPSEKGPSDSFPPCPNVFRGPPWLGDEQLEGTQSVPALRGMFLGASHPRSSVRSFWISQVSGAHFRTFPNALWKVLPPLPDSHSRASDQGFVSLCSCSLGHLCPGSWQPGTEAKRSSAQSGTGRPASRVSLLGEEGAETGGTAGSLDRRVWSALKKKLTRAGDELCEEGPQGGDAGTRVAQSHFLLHGGRGWAAALRAVRGESWGGWSLRTSG